MLNRSIIKKFITKYSAKLNFSFKIPRIFVLEQILDLTKAESEVLLCLFESCNQKGIIRKYNHSQYVETFDIPWPSWMRAFEKLEKKGIIYFNERTRDLIVKDYWKLIEKNLDEQKGIPLKERNNMGGYIKASWKLILSGKLRKIRPRAMRIFMYCYGRVDMFNTKKKNHNMLISEKTLCEMFRLAPCELEDYIQELFHHKLIVGEFDIDKKQWDLSIHRSIIDTPEDTLSLLLELQLQGGAKLEWISSKIYQLLHECNMLTKVHPLEALEMINLSKQYGHFVIERIIRHLRMTMEDQHRDTGPKQWPNKFIPWLQGAIDNLINEGVVKILGR